MSQQSDLRKALRDHGFHEVKAGGKHLRYQSPDGRVITIPKSWRMTEATARNILRQIEKPSARQIDRGGAGVVSKE